MDKHKRNEQKKQIDIPLEQIKYDPAKISERIKKIKKKRAIVNNSLTGVSFVLVIAAIVLLALFFIDGNAVNINHERILVNLQALYNRKGKMIAAHTKANVSSVKDIAVTTFFSLIIPNFLYLGSGIKEFGNRIGANIYPEQSLKQLWGCIAANGTRIVNGCKQLCSVIQENFSPISQGFVLLFEKVGEKILQIQK